MRSKMVNWTAEDWENAFQRMIDSAAQMLPEKVKDKREVLVVKTSKDNTFSVEIPDYTNWEQREKIEEAFIQKLVDDHDTEIILCVGLLARESITIPSYYFRKRLVEINPKNSETEILLQGRDTWIVKQMDKTL